MTVHYAFKDTDCVDCGTTILEGDPIYFNDDGKLCRGCGMAAGVVCPGCDGQKKGLYGSCFNCGGSREKSKKVVVKPEAPKTTKPKRKFTIGGRGKR